MLELPDAASWEAWLADHHRTQPDAWLRIAKRHAAVPLLAISDALDAALCFGWIDGQRKACDEVSFLQRYSPRRPRSSWSQVNVAKVEALSAAGRMRPAGLEQVAAARADGHWQAAYQSQRTADVPADLTAAPTEANAHGALAQLDRSQQYAPTLPLLKARTAAGRDQAVARAIAELAVVPATAAAGARAETHESSQ